MSQTTTPSAIECDGVLTAMETAYVADYQWVTRVDYVHAGYGPCAT